MKGEAIMPRTKFSTMSDEQRVLRPALTPDARENQMIFLAVDLAEKQLRDGTASSQVITHFLKLASTKEKLEKDHLEKQIQLLEAKTQNLQSIGKSEELYRNALNAMRTYTGSGGNDNDEIE
jgi:hypothetical protein